ncbi:MAG: hypothetical protein ACJ754_21160 [Pyrinomonadaceae bacterium]
MARLESYALDVGAAFLPAAVLCLRVAGASGGKCALRHNKRMHVTADTQLVISSNGLGRRVMRGVRLLLCYGPLQIESAGAAGSNEHDSSAASRGVRPDLDESE